MGLQVLIYIVKQNMLFHRKLHKAHCERQLLTFKLLIWLFFEKGSETVTNKNSMRAATINQEFYLQLSGGSELAFKLYNCG